ncbi:MAG: glycosyltransferase [Anaerolineae bacterium]|nr:glycosyltransferase [Anaerolineae bacterium]
MSTVSVIIPAYNQGHFLAEAVNSVLAQTYPRVEVIVVDDGSTDDTAVVAHNFTDPRVQYVYKQNGGLSSARNEGLRHAQGQYISYLDSDDCFLPEKLAILVGEMDAHPAVGFVAGQAIPVDEHGRHVGKKFDTPLPTDAKQLLLGNPLHVGSVLVRRDWQDKVGFFDESLRSYEDWDMWLRLAQAGCQMRYVPQPVSLYRFHTAQMTRDGRQMTSATFAVLDKLFADPTLPPDWLALKDKAYSQAYLRKTAQSYRLRDYHTGQESLRQAVVLDPSLMADEGAALARHFAAWVELPKTSDKFTFLEDIYNHLPPELTPLQTRRKQELGRAAMQVAFEAYEKKEMAETRTAVRRALRYQPGWLANRGALSIFLRSHLST